MTHPDSPLLEQRALEAAAVALHNVTCKIDKHGNPCRRPSHIQVDEARAAITAYLGASSQDAAPAALLDAATIETAQELLTMLRCPYYRNEGDKLCQSGCHDEPRCITNGPWDDVVIEVLESVADCEAPPADAAPGLREALVECRDWMGDGKNQPAQHHPGCEYLLSLVGGTCDCGHDALIAKAEAALGAPRSGTEGANG